MNDQNNDNETQPLDTEPLKLQSMRKTSAVPLRKETVRVTLKSTPAGAKGDSASSAPAPRAMRQHTSPQTSTMPSSKNPNIPDVTSAVPLKEETMRVTLKADPPVAAPVAPTPAAVPKPPVPAPAPTVPLNVGAGASAPSSKISAPAPTVPLNIGASATAPAVAPLATQPLGSSSQPLPKATVQLQQTQQLDKPGVGTPGEQAPTIQTVVDEDSSAERGNNVQTILAVAAFAMSLFVLFAQFKHAGVWVEAEDSSYGAIFSSK